MKEREAVGIFVGLQRRFVHQPANGEVGHHEAVELLPHQIGGFAAQDDLGAPQVRLQFVQRGLSGKGLARCAVARPVSSPSP